MNRWNSSGRRTRLASAGLVFAAALLVGSSSARAGDAILAPDVESFLGLPVGALDGIGGPAFNGSGLRTTLAANAGDVLSFRFNFLTNEDPTVLGDLINDFAFLTVDGADPTVLAEVASTPLSTSTALGFALESGLRSFSWTFTTSGIHTLGFGVINVVDALNPSALLVDALTLNGAGIPGGSFESGGLGPFSASGSFGVVGTQFGAAVPDGRFQAVLSSGVLPAAVPEPAAATSLLLGAAVLIVGVVLRRGR